MIFLNLKTLKIKWKFYLLDILGDNIKKLQWNKTTLLHFYRLFDTVVKTNCVDECKTVGTVPVT